MSRHFIYLTNTRLVSLTASGRRIAARREFAVSGAGATEFEQHLATVQELPTYLFVDLADEDFRLDAIPHVGGRDRSAVLLRKLSQIFRTTPYRHAVMQGREPDGRRDDRVLYTAITNPEALRPWVELLDRRKIPLEGIFSAAVFSATLLAELDLVQPHTLLVTFTPGSGMRQTYFKGDEIKFSRLAPIDLEPEQDLGEFVAAETTRTWQYLDSLRHFTPEDRLEVCVLLHARDRAAVQPRLRDVGQLHYRLVDIEETAIRLGLKPPPLDSTAEEVMVHLFMMHPAGNHFASTELRRHATIRRARSVLHRAAGAILALGVAWAGFDAFRAMQGAEVDHRLESQLAAVEAEREAIVRSTPSMGVAGSTMRDTVAFYNHAMRAQPRLDDFMVPISRVLSAHPEVRLTQVAWMTSDDAKASPRFAAVTAGDPSPVTAVSKAAPAPPPAPVPADAGAGPPLAGNRYEIALLEATVRVASEDFRGAIAEAQQLAEELSRLPGMTAVVSESPLDVSPSLQLLGRHETDAPPVTRARFVLRLVRDHGVRA